MRQRHAEIINSQTTEVEPPPQLVQSTGQWGHFSPIGPVFNTSGDELFDENDLAPTGSGCAVNLDGSRPVTWTSRGLATTSYPAPGAWWMARVGKGRAGRELDGRTWDEYPTVDRLTKSAVIA
jgi:hypothetical protein